jgi:integrase
MARLPSCRLRGNVWTADLRAYGAGNYHSLGLPATASPIEVGAAVQRAVDGLVSAGKVVNPELPGLESPGLSVRDLASQYQDAKDYPSKGGRSWGEDCMRRVQEGIGHLAVHELAAPAGEQVLRRWRDLLWEKGWRPRSVRNVLNFARAMLLWGQSDGRQLTGRLPKLPRFCRPGERMSEPDYTTLPEADFRHLRAHLFDGALHYQSFIRAFGRDPAIWSDYIARRQLYLSLAYYTGAHPEDLNTWRGEYLSVDVGRYERHNTKSSRVVEPECFDMPEQLQLDCQAELTRRGLPRFPQRELVACGTFGPWREATRTLNAAVARLWPGDPARKGFTFRISRRSCVWEYTIRGWRTHEIAAILGHVDETMIREVYRRCSQLSLISPVRVPWGLATGPRGRPTETGRILAFG